MQRQSTFKTLVTSSVLVAFLSLSIIPQGFAQSVLSAPSILPAPGTLLGVTPLYQPPTLKGIRLSSNQESQIEFIFDQGDKSLSSEELEKEAARLIRYFMTALTVPLEEQWVNLSPFEKDRIIPESFGQTEMGRDLLADDYLLKQLAASLVYPEEKIGEDFWSRIHAEVKEKYNKDIPIDTFIKVWIVPESSTIYQKDNVALISDSRLKVLLESDYFAMEHNQDKIPEGFKKTQQRLPIADEIIRDVIIPEIEREVNEGATFAHLRQIYQSVILAAWFRNKLKESILTDNYIGKNKIAGIDLQDSNAKEKIYQQYLKAFKVGVYDYIKEEYDPLTQTVSSKHYFSGGAELKETKPSVTTGSLPEKLRKYLTGAAGVFLVPITLSILLATAGSAPAEESEVTQPQATEQVDTSNTLARMVSRDNDAAKLDLLEKLGVLPSIEEMKRNQAAAKKAREEAEASTAERNVELLKKLPVQERISIALGYAATIIDNPRNTFYLLSAIGISLNKDNKSAEGFENEINRYLEKIPQLRDVLQKREEERQKRNTEVAGYESLADRILVALAFQGKADFEKSMLQGGNVANENESVPQNDYISMPTYFANAENIDILATFAENLAFARSLNLEGTNTPTVIVKTSPSDAENTNEAVATANNAFEDALEGELERVAGNQESIAGAEEVEVEPRSIAKTNTDKKSAGDSKNESDSPENSPFSDTGGVPLAALGGVLKGIADKKKKGGIDFNSTILQMEIVGDTIDLFPAELFKNLDPQTFLGINPVIQQITPITNIAVTLGIPLE